MSPVENSSGVVKPPPAANSVGRRVFLAGIWGLLGTFLGYSAGINYGVQVWPTLRANSPEDYSGRMFIIQTRAGCAGFVGLMAGALFGGLGCYAPRVPASGLIGVGGLAVAGFMTTAISAGLGEHRFAGWAWLTTRSAAVVFAFLAAFFLVRHKMS